MAVSPSDPRVILGFAGVMAIETSVAEVTVKLVAPEISPIAALTVVVPTVSAVAMPSLPEALLMAKTAGDDEPQVAWEVRSWVVPSEKVPVAANC